MPAECGVSKNGIHLWATGDAWGIIIGISRCKACGELATAAHFERVRIVDENGVERDVDSQVIV